MFAMVDVYVLVFLYALGQTSGFSRFSHNKITPTIATTKTALTATRSAKEKFLESLDAPQGFNSATRERTQLVVEMTNENPTPKAGSMEGFTPFAVGTWRIVYAPHIYTMGSLAGGSFDPVYYIMKPNGIMISHARYNMPFIGSGWLSVSGTYGSQDDDRVCRVDFDKAWVSPVNQKRVYDNNLIDTDSPFQTFDAVPESISKTIIQVMGQLGFVKSVSVFPVSYLDADTIVFDFELLGTRICARKIGPAE
jgi:hypothetical protein